MADTKEIKQSVYNALIELGLNESEIKLYTVSLFLGPASLSKIAKHMGISRPNVYKIISGLERNGLVNISDRRKYSRSFSVESPAVVLDKLRKKKDKTSELDYQLTSLMPDLIALYRQGQTLTRVKIFEKDEDQYGKLYNLILEEANEVTYFFGSLIEAAPIDVQKSWGEKRARKGIFLQSLVFPSENLKEFKGVNKKAMRELRFIKDLESFPLSFQIFGNKVIIWQQRVSLAILIEDDGVVQMFQSIFNHFWKEAETV